MKKENFEIQDENKIDYKKSLGQNFLFDVNLLSAIVRDGKINKEDTVLEIGAGAGTLTEQIAKVALKVISFEIDKTLSNRLNPLCEKYTNIELHFADFMDADINSLFEGRAKVVANIPYYITTPIIFKLADCLEKFDSILILIQKEVAERFASPEGTKDYGTTSVILQSLFDVSVPRVIRKECFTPMPKIDSALCLLVPHKKYPDLNQKEFREFVHHSFSMRRKTLVNNLKQNYSKENLEKILLSLGYSIAVRPEDISVENFIKIFKMLEKTPKNT